MTKPKKRMTSFRLSEDCLAGLHATATVEKKSKTQIIEEALQLRHSLSTAGGDSPAVGNMLRELLADFARKHPAIPDAHRRRRHGALDSEATRGLPTTTRQTPTAC